MLRSCTAVVWMTCLLATAWGRSLNEYGYTMMQDVETETTTQPIENGETGSQQTQQMGYAYGNQQTTTTSSELPPTSAPTQMLDIPMLSDNNYNQYSGYGSGYGEEEYNSGSSGEEYNSGSSGEEYNSGASGEESGSGLIGFDSLPENEEGSGEGSGSFSPSDCPNLADGNYAMSACGHQFLTCSNGNPFIFDCPAELVYNAKFDMCDWPSNMNCGDQEESGSGEGSGDFHGPSDCPTLADGNYAMSACGHQFLACSNGLPHVMDCPANLVYNWNVDQCDWPHDMGCEGGSGSDEPVSEESGSGAASGEESGEFSGEESSGEESGLTPVEQQPATTTTSTAQTSQESTTESSGLELLPSTYTAEPETSGIEETTPLAEDGSTEVPELSGEGEEGNGGIETETETETEEQVQMTTAMPTTTSSTQPESTTISTGVRHSQLDESLPSQPVDCSARADGNYQLTRCSTRFLACSNGIGHLMDCPDQLVFSAQLNACDFPSALMCDENSADTGVESDTLCSSDGVFATESCSPNFHNCINGKLFDLSCDSGQLFSWVRKLCLPAADFPECDLH